MVPVLDTNQLIKQNAIAYNTKLRDQLKRLHEMLGDEITDLVSGTLGDKNSFFPKAKKIIKDLSELTAQLSLILIEAKKTKTKLTQEEERDYQMITELTDSLGNLQYQLNKLLKNMHGTQDVEVFTTESLKVMEQITTIQEKFRSVRSQINDFGHLSNNPEIAVMFKNESVDVK